MKRLVIIIVALFLVGSMVGSVVAATITQTLAWPSDTRTLIMPFSYLYPTYNPRRARNIIHWRDTGITIAAPAGSMVYAAEDGIVQSIITPDPMNPYGSVIIEHTDATASAVKYTTFYSGVVGVLPAVGTTVYKGNYIATVQDFGTAGLGWVTELHFGVRNTPYDNSMLAGIRSLPSIAVALWGLPAFPDNYIDPITVLLP